MHTSGRYKGNDVHGRVVATKDLIPAVLLDLVLGHLKHAPVNERNVALATRHAEGVVCFAKDRQVQVRRR